MNLSRRGFLGIGIGSVIAAITRPEIAIHPVGVDLGFGKAGLDMIPMYAKTALSMKEWEDHVIDLLPMMERDFGYSLQSGSEIRVINGDT